MDIRARVSLSGLEQDLLAAISAGASNKQIAERLGKSPLTIRNQLIAIYRKIGVANRTQAAIWCQAHGMDS